MEQASFEDVSPIESDRFFVVMSCLLGFVTQCSWCVFGWIFAQTSEVRMLDTQDWGQELVSDGWVFGGCQDDVDFLVGFWLEDLHILIRMVVENMGSWCYGILWEGGQLQGRNKAFLAASQTFVSFKNALLTPYFLGGSVSGGRFTSLWNPSTQVSSPILRYLPPGRGRDRWG